MPDAPRTVEEVARPDDAGRAEAEASPRHLVRSASLVGGLTFLSRVTGLLRESMTAWYLGTGMAADAFRIAFLLPNLVRRLVGEGAITSAFVPVYALSLHRDGAEAGRVFAQKFLSFWLLIVSAFTILGVVLAEAIVSGVFAWGAFADPEKVALTTTLARFLFGYVFLIGAVAAAQGILNAHGVFGLPAFAPVAFNLAFAAAAWLLVGRLGVGNEPHAMSYAILIAGAVQLLVLVPPLLAVGVRLRPCYPFDHPGVKEVLRLLLPGTLGAGIYQINVTLSTALAARLGDGAVSSLSYSNRLMEFALGIFVFALSTVSLTTLARQSAAGDRSAFERTLSEILRLTLFITLPSTVGLFVLARPILSLLFQSGQFDVQSLDLTEAAFHFHVLGMVSVGWNRVLVACCHARKDLKTPVLHGAVNMLVHLALAYVLSEALGHSGIALAATAAAALQTVTLRLALGRRLPGLRIRGLPATALKTLAASAIMGAFCWFALRLLGLESPSKAYLAGAMAVLIGGGAAVFFVAAALLRIEEASTLAGALLRRRIGGARSADKPELRS